MDQAIYLRPVEREDRGFLEGLYASTRELELQPLDWSEDQKRQFLHEQFEAQDHYYHEHFPDCAYQVVMSDQEAIGRLYVDRREEELRIVDIALLPEYRGLGLGRALMVEILDEAKEAGLLVRIHVEKFNPALRLYERLGFQSLGEVGAYYFMECDPRNRC